MAVVAPLSRPRVAIQPCLLPRNPSAHERCAEPTNELVLLVHQEDSGDHQVSPGPYLGVSTTKSGIRVQEVGIRQTDVRDRCLWIDISVDDRIERPGVVLEEVPAFLDNDV